MTSNEPTRVEVSRRIGAGASEIFSILADPGRHTDIDGSGMLRGAITDSVVSRVGDVFAMKMYYEQFGDYEMDNHVVEYELDRRITWEPERRDIEESSWHHRWGFELTPDGAGVTVVTESFDCSRAPEEGRRAVKNGTTWTEAMTATLERLDLLCSDHGVGTTESANASS
jgi:hypothetical protein